MATKLSANTTRYIVSTLITFAAGFLVVVTPEVATLSVDTFEQGALVGILLAGARAGVKAVVEAFILPS